MTEFSEYVRQILRRKDLAVYLVTSGLKAQHRNTLLGYFWWLLDPLLGVAIYYFVVGIVFGRGGPEYLMNLMVGLSVWRWLQASIVSAAKSITSRAGIVSQVYLPKVILPTCAVLSQLVNFGFGLLVLLAFVVGVWDMPGLSVLWIPFIVLIQLLVIMALALPLAYVSVFVRDMDNLIGHLLRIWFYASPIVWVRSAIPQGWSWILDLNPMAYLLSSFSDVLLYDKSPNVSKLLVIGAGALVVIFWSTYYYSRNEHRIVKVL